MVGTENKPAKPGGDVDGLFKALADSSRRKILRLLAKEELPLKRIEEQFRISRPAIIKHIGVLKVCRLVKVHKRGRETIHSLNLAPLRTITDWVSQLDMLWGNALQRLKQQVESET
jgi:DNA-binding transcriptional ArsR family regulator